MCVCEREKREREREKSVIVQEKRAIERKEGNDKKQEYRK